MIAALYFALALTIPLVVLYFFWTVPMAIAPTIILFLAVVYYLYLKYKKCHKCKSRIFIKERSGKYACIRCNAKEVIAPKVKK